MAKALLFGLMGVAMGMHLQEDSKPTLPDSIYSFQADSGEYLAVCSRCDENEPNLALLKDFTDPKRFSTAAWVVENTG